MDRGAWWATPHGVTESRTLLSDFQIHIHMLACSLSLFALSLFLTLPLSLLIILNHLKTRSRLYSSSPLDPSV